MTEPARDHSGHAHGAAAAASRARQWRLLATAAALLVGAVLLAWLAERLLHPPAPPPAATPPGTFRATAQQLRTLGIEAVPLRDLVDSEVADGRIAADPCRIWMSAGQARVDRSSRRMLGRPRPRGRLRECASHGDQCEGPARAGPSVWLGD